MDTCNALTKVGPVTCVCAKEKGHPGDHHDPSKKISWPDDPWYES